MKPKLFLAILLLTLSSCATKKPFQPHHFTQEAPPAPSAKIAFKLKSDRLVYLDEGIEKNAVAIKWCKVSDTNGCEEYFYSYHCDSEADSAKCAEIERQFFQTHNYKKTEGDQFFQTPYAIYEIKAGGYYLGELQEIKSYKLEDLDCKQELLVEKLLEKRKGEIKQMARDSIISKAFFSTGAVLVYSALQGGGASNQVGLVVMAGGGALMLIAMPINSIFTGDMLYVENFKSKKSGWDHQLKRANFLSFEAKAGETTYLGDVFIHLIARGGYWPERRDGIIDFAVENNAKKFIENYPQYKKEKLSVKLFDSGLLAGKHGAGRF